MKPGAERLDVSTEELDALVEQARAALDEAGYQKLKAAIRTLGVVTALLENQETTLESLRNLLCQAQTEKTAAVLKRAGVDTVESPRFELQPFYFREPRCRRLLPDGVRTGSPLGKDHLHHRIQKSRHGCLKAGGYGE